MSPIIIIGMHRSGTTLLCQMLESAGVFMGHYKDQNLESYFFNRMNHNIFRELNSSWDNVSVFKDYDLNGTSIFERWTRHYIKSLWNFRYLGLKNRSFMDLEHWGWKDPKNTFTLPIWRKIYPNARVLNIYRNPIDVSSSLKVRSERKFEASSKNLNLRILPKMQPLRLTNSYRCMSLMSGIKLWDDYVSQSLTYDNVYSICYEDLLEDPINVLTGIIDFCGITLSAETLKSIAVTVNASRRFSFARSPDLVNLAHRLKEEPLIKKLGYYSNEVG